MGFVKMIGSDKAKAWLKELLPQQIEDSIDPTAATATKTFKITKRTNPLKVNPKTGKVTVKKGLQKGTYKVKVQVKAAGNASYKASKVKTVTFKINVK